MPMRPRVAVGKSKNMILTKVKMTTTLMSPFPTTQKTLEMNKVTLVVFSDANGMQQFCADSVANKPAWHT